ncbi:hypothetical protein D3C78_342580 [compost metagenome]
MSIYFIAESLSFRDSQFHAGNIPEDAPEISAETHAELLAGQSRGARITADSDGLPILIEPPAETPEQIAQATTRRIAETRFRHEVSGITINGQVIDTSREGQSLLTGAAVAAMLDPNYRCRWKSEGGFVELDATQVIGLASAVRVHVQACFDREAELLEALKKGEFSEAMLDEGWPSQ